MNFWKFMISFFIVSTIADFTYLKLDFFQYSLFKADVFQWVTLIKFLVEIIIFAVLLYGLYNLLEFLEKWRMERKYIKTQKELANEAK
ncbi:hypothetical protein [Planomicrobium sp. MB-3u-38]|uniref:hypothetical protein n=1 Tax=Planomicrobium sp. MB-3u-38 TaxID=2058318 RepID=UPI000C7DF133|nr:hypothetical protein [Planomicrobium sp. MB-3u-38]PKH08671.1 hypothetical protein CXF70_15860 [Planomicrobium sp. MB-3u-38]